MEPGWGQKNTKDHTKSNVELRFQDICFLNLVNVNIVSHIHIHVELS